VNDNKNFKITNKLSKPVGVLQLHLHHKLFLQSNRRIRNEQVKNS
jgi:hypothetical protein